MSLNTINHQKRPLGVVMLAAFLALVALYGLSGAIPALATSRGIPVAYRTVAIGVAVLLLFNAWGLWNLERWALQMVRLLLAVNLAILVYNFFVGGFGLIMTFEAMIFAGVLAYTVLDEACRRAFH